MYIFKISILTILLLFLILFIIHEISCRCSNHTIERMTSQYNPVVGKCQHIDTLQDYSSSNCNIDMLTSQCDMDPTCNNVQRKNDGSHCVTSKLKDNQVASDGSKWYNCGSEFTTYFKPNKSVQKSQSNQPISSALFITDGKVQDEIINNRKQIFNLFQNQQKKTAKKIDSMGKIGPNMIHKQDIAACTHNTIDFDIFEQGLGHYVNSNLKGGDHYMSLPMYIKKHLKSNPSGLQLSDFNTIIIKYINNYLPKSEKYIPLIDYVHSHLRKNKKMLSRSEYTEYIQHFMYKDLDFDDYIRVHLKDTQFTLEEYTNIINGYINMVIQSEKRYSSLQDFIKVNAHVYKNSKGPTLTKYSKLIEKYITLRLNESVEDKNITSLLDYIKTSDIFKNNKNNINLKIYTELVQEYINMRIHKKSIDISLEEFLKTTNIPKEDIAKTLDLVTKGAQTTAAQTTAAQTTSAQTISAQTTAVQTTAAQTTAAQTTAAQTEAIARFTNPPPFVPQGLPTFLSTQYSKLL
jgi:hypothetical protein